jgi:hypothetical protein
MSKKLKVLVPVLVAVVLLTVGITVPVMAQDDESAPEVGDKGLLARVAAILDIPEEDLVNAFKQAQQEMREEAFIEALDKAVEKGWLTQEEADQIEEWWQQRPEIIDRDLSRLATGLPGLRFRLWANHKIGLAPRLHMPRLSEAILEAP